MIFLVVQMLGICTMYQMILQRIAVLKRVPEYFTVPELMSIGQKMESGMSW